VNACSFLFLHPPRKGKVLIETLNDLVTQISFPDDPEKAFRILSSDNYLGKAKDSVTKNFLVCLMKKLLKEEPAPSYVTAVKRMCAAINALHRIKPQLSAETLREQLPRLLIGISDQRMCIVFPILNQCPFLSRDVDTATRLRLPNIIHTLSSETVSQLDIPSLADKDEQVKSALLTKYESLDLQGRHNILKTSSSTTLKDKAIEMFSNSGSYAAAYDNGKNILLPHAPHFDLSDLNKVFEGTINNKYNQIIPASGIDNVFIELYKATKNRFSHDNSEWSSFIDSLPKNSYIRGKLDEAIRPTMQVVTGVENA
jgi:hypothetical protein